MGRNKGKRREGERGREEGQELGGGSMRQWLRGMDTGRPCSMQLVAWVVQRPASCLQALIFLSLIRFMHGNIST